MTKWTPTMRDWILRLDEHATTEPGPTMLDVRDDLTLHRNLEGALSLHLPCDAELVQTDTSAARLRVDRDDHGAVVTVGADVPRVLAAHVLDDVLHLLDDEVARTAAGLRTIDRFRDLVASPPGEALGRNAREGLWGELFVLRVLLEHGGNTSHWVGWSGTPKDFVLPRLQVEVKSTTRDDWRRVEIHGLGQLADPLDGSPLMLVLMRLEATPSGESLPDLVDTIVPLAPSRADLLQQLHGARYSEAHRGAYLAHRYVAEVVACRWVDEDHPRLDPTALRPVDTQAIDGVRYRLDLNGTDAEDIGRPLEELLEGGLS